MNLDIIIWIVDACVLFGLGIIIGSFLNVVVLRMGSGKSFSGRSKCMSCGHTLRSYMLVPILSYLFLRGRCAFCRTKISPQYPIIEFATGLLVLLTGMHYQISFIALEMLPYMRFSIEAVALCTLVVIAAYDLRHKIIPDRLSFLLAILGLAALGLRAYAGEVPSMMPLFAHSPLWLDLIAAPVLSLPLAAIWYFSKGKGMGLGDAKLMWGVGWYLGVAGGLSALFFSFWLATIPALAILFSKKGNLHTEIPFGPYIALGTMLVYFFGWNVLNLGLSLI